MRRWSWIALGVLATGIAGASALAKPPALMVGAPGQGLQLRADRLNYLPGKGKIKLTGRVRLRRGKLTLNADKVVVHLDRKSQRPRRALASGAVRLTQDTLSASARRVSLILLEELSSKSSPTAELVDARVTRKDGFQLQGQRIYLDLSSGELVVHNAKARLPGRTGVRSER